MTKRGDFWSMRICHDLSDKFSFIVMAGGGVRLNPYRGILNLTCKRIRI